MIVALGLTVFYLSSPYGSLDFALVSLSLANGELQLHLNRIFPPASVVPL